MAKCNTGTKRTYTFLLNLKELYCLAKILSVLQCCQLVPTLRVQEPANLNWSCVQPLHDQQVSCRYLIRKRNLLWMAVNCALV